MCATEDGLSGLALYGPTQRGDTAGRVGACKLEEFALDEDVAKKTLGRVCRDDGA